MNNRIEKFDQRISNPEPQIVALLGEIDGIKGELKSGLRMTPQAITGLKRSVLITSAGSSTRIEGAKLQDQEVDKVMRGLTASKLAERDYQEVQGYLEVLQNVFNGYKTLPLRESVIQSLHNELLKYSNKDQSHKGKYKTKENTVGVLGSDGKTIAQVIFNPTAAWATPSEMIDLVSWTYEALEEGRFHSLLVIANFLVEFLKIHPFEDGNGRLSRVLTNLLLLRSGYQFAQYVSHEQIIEHRKDEYYIALRKSQETFGTDKDTIIPWLNFFLSVVRTQAVNALTYLEEEKIEDTLSPKQFEVWKYLVSVPDAARGDVVKVTGIAEATINQSLDRLIELGKIKRIGRGRGTRYVKI